jgi:hypothetical protein
VNGEVIAAPANAAPRLWRDPASWMLAADIFAILTALALPWSTSLVAIFMLCWLATAAWVLDYKTWFRLLKQPIGFLPIALFALAAVGTLWSDASWYARLYAIGPAVKLLVLPGLFCHFARSSRGMWVLIAFLGSCSLLMAISWIVVLNPGITLKTDDAARGIFVKNYIDQSQEFALCAVALAWPIVMLLREKRIWLAALLATVSLGFVINMALVIVSRTALVTMPIMLAVFAALHLKWRSNVAIFCAAVVLAGLAWTASPQLRQTTAGFSRDYRIYRERGLPTSIGMRLEFWQKSLHFFAEAPLIGHGTGSTRGLFEEAAATASKALAAGQVIGNPHNQTLNVAVQWGLVGVALLYAMWWYHLLLFRGDGLVAWIGLLVVVQNIFTSLFNSHLFDFHEGWMYVLGAGVAGGMTLGMRERASAAWPGSGRS